MSARGYEVVIRLKDSPLLKQLQRMEQEGVRLGTAMGGIPTKQFDVLTKQLPAQTGLLQKIFGGGVSQVLKLTAIGAGVGGLVALMQKSSGILSGVFKLWEFGITLLIKPIADFIGLLLRPITLLLLTNFIMPWFKTVYPFFRDFGKILGEQFAKDPLGTLLDIILSVAEFMTKGIVGGFLTGINSLITGLNLLIRAVIPSFLPAPSVPLINIGSVLGGIGDIFTGIRKELGLFPSLLDLISKFIDFQKVFGPFQFEAFKRFQRAREAEPPDLYTKTLQDIFKTLPGAKKGQFGLQINEPVAGFGLRSGSRYLFGEAGPEAITPLSQMSKSFTINMNIGGIVDTVNLAHERAKLRTTINAIADTL